jgi:hypothetical protein
MYLWGRNLFFKNPYFAENYDIVTFNNSRRKLGDDGKWWDIHFDELYETNELDYLHLERPYLNSHFTPARTDNVSYLDVIEYTPHIVQKANLVSADITDDDRERIQSLKNRANDRFDVVVDMESYIESKVIDEKIKKPLYDRLLTRLDPEIVLLVVSYGKETEIKSCKQHDVPVVEFQHGGFGPDHMGYSFPGDRKKSLFPDYLFVFGELWRDNVEFPIPDERVIPVGFPHLEREVSKYKDTEKRDEIIVISQGPFGEYLSKFAIEIAKQDEIDHDVVYKLHPGEYDRWRSEYPWLDDPAITVIENDSTPLYKLLSRSKAQVGVNSTVIYEGLNFGLDTYLLEAPGISRMKWLWDLDCVSVVDSVEAFLEAFEPTVYDIDTSVFFEKDSTRKMVNSIDKIIEGEL